MKRQFSVESTSCNHYVARVGGTVSALDDVQKVKVDLKKTNGMIESDEAEAQSGKICQAVNELGYKAEVI